MPAGAKVDLDRPGDQRDRARSGPRGPRRGRAPRHRRPVQTLSRLLATIRGPEVAADADPVIGAGMAEGLPISFLSDYGDEDEFAGVCRAVIRQIAPDAPLIDITHGIGRQGISARGAGARQRAALHAAGGPPRRRRPRRRDRPPPGRGDDDARRGASSSGPTTGCSPPAIERFGGAARAIDISRSPFRLEPVSATFHGRDLFAPVAAHLALGARLDEAGEKFDPSELATLRAAERRGARRRGRRARAARGPLRQRQPRPLGRPAR